MTAVLLVSLGAAVGAPGRWLVDRAVQRRHTGLVPWGTLTVNLVGSLVLGGVLGWSSAPDRGHDLALLLGTGFCGAFTTFSTFAVESVRLLEGGRSRYAAGYVLLSLVAGCLLAAVGWWLGTRF
ncbi:fluoride efflux transporter CrcB [Lapillicoccus sp.]|uniref:fluoride efflux transporter CrcB n=1 Tax=Lapillicoccus sp. TaxID=1909287 RepID=UPI0025ECE3A8|nr:fluoride efflux transporter CrcB [Lapillicoccus sp.]